MAAHLGYHSTQAEKPVASRNRDDLRKKILVMTEIAQSGSKIYLWHRAQVAKWWLFERMPASAIRRWAEVCCFPPILNPRNALLDVWAYLVRLFFNLDAETILADVWNNDKNSQQLCHAKSLYLRVWFDIGRLDATGAFLCPDTAILLSSFLTTSRSWPSLCRRHWVNQEQTLDCSMVLVFQQFQVQRTITTSHLMLEIWCMDTNCVCE